MNSHLSCLFYCEDPSMDIYMVNKFLPILAIVHCAMAKTFLFRWKISIAASGRAVNINPNMQQQLLKTFIVPRRAFVLNCMLKISPKVSLILLFKSHRPITSWDRPSCHLSVFGFLPSFETICRRFLFGLI